MFQRDKDKDGKEPKSDAPKEEEAMEADKKEQSVDEGGSDKEPQDGEPERNSEDEKVSYLQQRTTFCYSVFIHPIYAADIKIQLLKQPTKFRR